MSSGGESSRGSSDDERNRTSRTTTHQVSSSRRPAFDVSDDDNSDDDGDRTPSRKQNGKRYDDEDDEDNNRGRQHRDRDDYRNKSNGNGSGAGRNRKRNHSDDEDGENERDEYNRSGGGGGGGGGSYSKKAKKEEWELADSPNQRTINEKYSRYSEDEDEIQPSKHQRKEHGQRNDSRDRGHGHGHDDDDDDDENNRGGSGSGGGGSGVGGGSGGGNEGVCGVEQEMEKSKMTKKKRNNRPDDTKIESDCVTFLEQMKRARDEDLKSFYERQPALEKIKMLARVEKIMANIYYKNFLLDNWLLGAFRSWLDRLPDGSLPNIQVRTTLLNLLLNLPMDEDWIDRLESSNGLGKVIHYLSLKDDHPPNQRLAQQIMNKWARPIYRMDNNYNDLLYEFDKPDEGHRAGKDSIANERKAAMRTVQRIKTTEEKLRDSRKSSDGKAAPKIMATVPRPAHFLFTTVAEGNIQMDEKEAKQIRTNIAKQKKIAKTKSKLQRLTKGAGASSNKPSLNGR